MRLASRLQTFEPDLKNEGTTADSKLWVAFPEILVESLLVDVDVVGVSPVPAVMHDNDSVIDACQIQVVSRPTAELGDLEILSGIKPARKDVEGASNACHRCWRLDGSRACGCICSKIRLVQRGI